MDPDKQRCPWIDCIVWRIFWEENGMEGSHCEVKHTTDSSADSNDCAVITGSDWRGYLAHFSRLIEAIVMTTDAAGWDKTPSALRVVRSFKIRRNHNKSSARGRNKFTDERGEQLKSGRTTCRFQGASHFTEQTTETRFETAALCWSIFLGKQ